MTRIAASDKVRRVLALVPWIMAQPGGAPVAETCRRFGMTRQQLLAELERLRMIGVYPYSGDKYLDWALEGDRITIRLADWFAKPPRLTPEQALTLIATAQGLAGIEGVDPDGPLARGVAKVAAVLGVDPTTVEVDLGPAEAGLLSSLRQAIEERRQVQLDYYTFGRDERRQRTVDPYLLSVDGGHWYLRAWCHDEEDVRIFRIDRILAATVLDDRFPAPDDLGDAGGVGTDAATPRVTLEIDPSQRWVAESYPVDRVEERQGRLLVTLPVTGVRWLERLLLRLGADARLIEGPEEWRRCGAEAAQRVLARYQD